MGYDLHITRATNRAQSRDHPISAEEWLRIVEEDPELSLAGYNGDYFALWSGKSRYPDPWLNWFDGRISSKNPDDPIIEKMIELAGRLGAHVVGDDGEFYTWVDGKISILPSIALRQQRLRRLGQVRQQHNGLLSARLRFATSSMGGSPFCCQCRSSIRLRKMAKVELRIPANTPPSTRRRR